MENSRTFKALTGLFFSIVFLIVLPASASAASMYLDPASGSCEIGKTFTVNVYITSADKAMNAASGVIYFPPNKLEVVSLEKEGSIFSLWIEEPSFSNSVGTISFKGVMLNPGFIGLQTKALTVKFKAKAVSDAKIFFSSGSILANDGSGGNILTGVGSAVFRIDAPPVGPLPPESTTPVEPVGVPSAPKIFSLTHPNPNEWYASNNPEFKWVKGDDVTGVSVLVDKKSNSNPGGISDGLLDSYKDKNIENGVWYFHVRLKNSFGWGGISHFRFNVDTEKPSSFDIKEIERSDLTEPEAKFIFTADDKISGTDYYQVQIDGKDLMAWADTGDHTYKTPILPPGQHTLIAKVFDKAGNALASSAVFEIKPLSAPTITDFPLFLENDEALIVKGETRFNEQVILWLQKDKDEPLRRTVIADKDGKFVFIADDKLSEGIYKLWAKATDERGAQSEATPKKTIIVKPSAVIKIGSQAVAILSVFVPLVSVILILFALVWFGWHKFFAFRKRVLKETREAEGVLHNTIHLLKDGIKEQIKLLEKARTKRELTDEEDKIVKKFKKDLSHAEQIVDKEI